MGVGAISFSKRLDYNFFSFIFGQLGKHKLLVYSLKETYKGVIFFSRCLFSSYKCCSHFGMLVLKGRKGGKVSVIVNFWLSLLDRHIVYTKRVNTYLPHERGRLPILIDTILKKHQ